MEVRVSPHRHSQSLSRDVPSTIRLPSAIRCVDKDDEKSTKNTKIGEEENIFCRRRRLRLASSRSPRLFGASQKSFFSSAQKAARLCVRRRCDRVFFLPEKKKRKRRIFERKFSAKSSQIPLLPLKFFDTLPSSGKIGSHLFSSQQQTTRAKIKTHTTYIIKKNFLLSLAPEQNDDDVR